MAQSQMEAHSGGSEAEKEMSECLPEYEIDHSPFGGGAFGLVYKAKEKDDKSCVRAVKVLQTMHLPPETRDMHIESVKKEIGLLRKASSKFSNGHPNIVRLYRDVQTPSGYFFLVMEYCPGKDLDVLIKRHKRRHTCLEYRVAKRLLRDLMRALQFMRSENITHRDLKPANLLLTSQNQYNTTLKVADFGLACELSAESLRRTQSGTPLYMAPEMLEKKRYGEKVDLWAVGAILYEMVTGRKVYHGVNTPKELFAAVAKGNPKLVLPKSADLQSSQCKDLLSKLLVADPEKRISFDDFYAHAFVQPDPPSSLEDKGGVTSSLEDEWELIDSMDYKDSASEEEPCDPTMAPPQISCKVEENSSDGHNSRDTESRPAKQASQDDPSDTKASASSEQPPEPVSGASSSVSVLTVGSGSCKRSDPHAQPSDVKPTRQTSQDGQCETKASASGEQASDPVPDDSLPSSALVDKAPPCVSISDAASTVQSDESACKESHIVDVAIESQSDSKKSCETALANKTLDLNTDSSSSFGQMQVDEDVCSVVDQIDSAVLDNGEASDALSEKKVLSNLAAEDTVAIPRHNVDYCSISTLNSKVLFFRLDGSTYMAFHDGNSKHHYLDLDVVKELQRLGSLPNFFIGRVIQSETLAATATQNPFLLPEGTKFTILTTNIVEDDCPDDESARSLAKGSHEDKKQITIRSFSPGDTVLCIPAQNPSNLSEGAPAGTYMAFQGSAHKSVYYVSTESMDAFKQKCTYRRNEFLLGTIIMITPISGVNNRFSLTLAPL